MFLDLTCLKCNLGMHWGVDGSTPGKLWDSNQHWPRRIQYTWPRSTRLKPEIGLRDVEQVECEQHRGACTYGHRHNCRKKKTSLSNARCLRWFCSIYFSSLFLLYLCRWLLLHGKKIVATLGGWLAQIKGTGSGLASNKAKLKLLVTTSGIKY